MVFHESSTILNSSTIFSFSDSSRMLFGDIRIYTSLGYNKPVYHLGFSYGILATCMCYTHAASLRFTPTSYQDQSTNSISYRTLMGLWPELLFHIPIIISFTIYHYSAPFDISLSISFSLFHILNLEPENGSD